MTTFIVSALAWALGVVLLASAGSKLRRPRAFAHVLRDYRLVPEALIWPAAWLIVATEGVLAGLFLLAGPQPVAAASACLVFLTFMVAVVVNLKRGRRISCGCFGAESEVISYGTVARLTVLCAACVAVGGAVLAGTAPVSVVDFASQGQWIGMLGIAASSSILIAGVVWIGAYDAITLALHTRTIPSHPVEN